MDSQVVEPYAPPTPPAGVHRYVFTLFQQPQKGVNITVSAGHGWAPCASNNLFWRLNRRDILCNEAEYWAIMDRDVGS